MIRCNVPECIYLGGCKTSYPKWPWPQSQNRQLLYQRIANLHKQGSNITTNLLLSRHETKRNRSIGGRTSRIYVQIHRLLRVGIVQPQQLRNNQLRHRRNQRHSNIADTAIQQERWQVWRGLARGFGIDGHPNRLSSRRAHLVADIESLGSEITLQHVKYLVRFLLPCTRAPFRPLEHCCSE